MRTKVLASKDSDSLEIEVVTVEESQLCPDRSDLRQILSISVEIPQKDAKPTKIPQAVWDAVANSVSLQKFRA